MNIRPVKTDRDYDSALARIENLWSAEPGTCEDDELEILSKIAQFSVVEKGSFIVRDFLLSKGVKMVMFILRVTNV